MRLWCRQVRFNRVPEKVPQKVPGEGSRKPWCKAKSGSTGSGEGSSAWLLSTPQKNLQKKITLRLLGIPPKLIFFLQ